MRFENFHVYLWNLTAFLLLSLTIFRYYDSVSIIFSISFVITNFILFASLNYHRSSIFRSLPRWPIIMLGAFLAAGIISAALSPYSERSLGIAFKDILIITSAGIFVINTAVVDKVMKLFSIFRLALLICLLALIIDALLNLSSYGLVGVLFEYRAKGILGSPSANGHLFATTGALLILAPNIYSNENPLSKLKSNKFIWISIAIVIILTKSGSLLFATLVMILLSFEFFRKKHRLIILSIIYPILTFSLYTMEKNNFSFFGVAVSSSGRAGIIDNVLPRIDNSTTIQKIIGVGPGTVKYWYISRGDFENDIYQSDLISELFDGTEDSIFLQQHRYSSDVYGPVVGNSLHSIFVDLFIQYGYLGTLFFILFSLTYLMQNNSTKGSSNRNWLLSQCVFVIFLGRAQFETPGMIGGYVTANMALWVVLALPIIQSLYSTVEARAGGRRFQH